MADDQNPQASSASGSGTGLFIPPALRVSHGELIELIIHSESMNDEERQYWVDILPVMTPDQIAQLRTILTNERDQLAAIDAKYAKDVTQEKTLDLNVEEIGEQRQERSAERAAKEQEAETVESATEEEILKQVQNL